MHFLIQINKSGCSSQYFPILIPINSLLPFYLKSEKKNMSRLNATIKLVVLVGNILFLLLSLIVIAGASLITSEKMVPVKFLNSFQKIVAWVLFLAIATFLTTLYGCCGSLNQTIRKGCFAGRRALCVHQLLLITVLIASSIQVSALERREASVRIVVQTRFYDSFEESLNFHFNQVYFDAMCRNSNADNGDVDVEGGDTGSASGSGSDGSFQFAMDWIDKTCPSTMTSNQCSTVCDFPCPDPYLCLEQGLTKSCPYYQCRSEILQKVQNILLPTIAFLRLVSIISATMIIGTCLLICYNPRDDIELELLKSGVMTEEDVNTIRKLKSMSQGHSLGRTQFSYDKGRKSTGLRTSINLDALHENQNRASVHAGDGGNHGNYLTKTTKRNSNANGRIHPAAL